MVMLGSGAIWCMEAIDPILARAAVIVAAVMLAIAAFMVMLIGMFIDMFMGMFIFMGMEKDMGLLGLGKGSWRTALGRRLSGMGIPALAHMAAALALAISSNWSLSSSVSRGGLLLVSRLVRAGDLFLRRMRTGEWLGSRFQRSLWLSWWLPNAPLPLRREPERDLDLFDLRAGDRDLDRFLFGDLDFERLFRVLDLDRDFFFLVPDVERDFFLRDGVLDFLLWPGVEDLDFLFLPGDLDLDLLFLEDFASERFF